MLLVAGPSPEFLRFIQILCWIVGPVLALVVLITVFLHYRKRRKDNNEDNEPDQTDKFMQASPEQVGYTNGDGEYVLFDHSRLISEYKNRLTYSNARVTALKRDLTSMEKRYTALAGYVRANLNLSTSKNKIMKSDQEQMPDNVLAQVNKSAKEQEIERNELLIKLQHLEKSYQRLEEENKALVDQVKMETATDDEKAMIINKWKEENSSLREKVATQEYLEDLLQEKKAQIIFLQNQLEQRIKDIYRAEHLRLQTVAEVKQAKEDSDSLKKNIESLKNELLIKQEQADAMQIVLCEKEEQLTGKQQQLNDKLDHIAYLENNSREAKEHNEILKAAVADSKDQVILLQQQLSDEKARVELMDQQLSDNKQLLRKLYKELSNFIDGEGKESPVIALRPDYSNKENEETVV